MKKFAFQAIALLIVIFFGLALYTSKIPFVPFLPQTSTTGTVIIGASKFNVEIADTQEKRNKGLSDRENLASDSGMLFIFDKQDKYPFWMKGIKFPLDFIWIRGDLVVDFLQNIQPPIQNQSDQSLTIYTATMPIDKVLEVPAGTIDRLNIKIGDKIQVQK